MAADPFAFAAEELTAIRDAGLYRERRVCDLLPGGLIDAGGSELWNFASNDYLGLAAEPPPPRPGGSGASALVTGRSSDIAELERRLAELKGVDAALLFPTGYAANLGTVSALLRPGDTALVDRLSHSCLVEGVRLSGATMRVYHADRLSVLDRELGNANGGRRVVITDGVFSMDGTVAPLWELHDLCESRDAILVVDEAHGTGVFGPTGAGVCEAAGLASERLVTTGTLSKALGTLGGFVCGRSDVIDWLRHHARTQVYSTALPPALAAKALRSLDVIRNEPERRDRLFALADRLRDRLRRGGCDVPSSVGPIVPVLLGEPGAASEAAAKLESRGFLVGCIRPPTVPGGTSRLRISVSAVHDAATIDSLADALTT